MVYPYKYASVTSWVTNVKVLKAHGCRPGAGGKLEVIEVIGPQDRETGYTRPHARVGLKIGTTYAWTALWKIPEEVDLSGWDLY